MNGMIMLYFTAGCKLNWQTFTGTKSYGAVLKLNITTLIDCKKQCENSVSCVGVDFNFKKNPQQCWFHDDSNKILKKVPDVEVDQYVLDRCYTDGKKTCSHTENRLSLSLVYVAATYFQKRDNSAQERQHFNCFIIIVVLTTGCQIRWNNLTSTGSVGAMLQSGLTFLDDCLNGCILDTSCVAVDFNFKAIPKQCWFHTEMNKVQAKRRDVQTNQYILDRCYKCEYFNSLNRSLLS